MRRSGTGRPIEEGQPGLDTGSLRYRGRGVTPWVPPPRTVEARNTCCPKGAKEAKYHRSPGRQALPRSVLKQQHTVNELLAALG